MLLLKNDPCHVLVLWLQASVIFKWLCFSSHYTVKSADWISESDSSWSLGHCWGLVHVWAGSFENRGFSARFRLSETPDWTAEVTGASCYTPKTQTSPHEARSWLAEGHRRGTARKVLHVKDITKNGLLTTLFAELITYLWTRPLLLWILKEISCHVGWIQADWARNLNREGKKKMCFSQPMTEIVFSETPCDENCRLLVVWRQVCWRAMPKTGSWSRNS